MTTPSLPALHPAFEERLREVLHSDVEFIELIGEDLVCAGGKRIRPLLTLTSANALGIEEGHPLWPSVIELAVCVELLHSASLLHDDLIDDSATRRGHETAYRRFGNVVSVMSGDFMLARLLEMLAPLPQVGTLVRAFGQTASAICEGEVLQFQVAAYGDYSLENYWRIIHGKTGVLLELATSAPALLCEASSEVTEALQTFGREYGTAFQLTDDWLDLMGQESQLGKPIGGDLREGKATFEVLKLLEGVHAHEVREILERGASVTGDIERIHLLVAEQGNLSQQEIARRLCVAQNALTHLPDSKAREALHALTHREITRRG